MTFDELLTARAVLEAEHDRVYETRHACQAALESALIAAAKAKGVKRVRLDDVDLILSKDECAAVRAPFQKAWDDTYGATTKALVDNRAAMRDASEAAEFSPAEARTEWLLFQSVWTSTYSTQGYGCTTYTEVSSFDVYVKVANKRDVELLKHKPEESLREWVRKCWARGSNPRVSAPFLPHGYEESQGLDFFGNDLRKNPAAGPYRRGA